MEKRSTNIAKLLLKIVLSSVALFVVYQNIDRQQLITLFAAANLWWIALGLALYNISKISSAYRLSDYFRANQIIIQEKDNLRLYYVGMFYNLFLPGGIGGDAYKIWLIHKQISKPPKSILQSVLFDRFSGMMALGVLCFLFSWLAFPSFPLRSAFLFAGVITIPALFLLVKFLAPQFRAGFLKTSIQSLWVQVVQVGCAFALLQSLGIIDHVPAYFAVFLFSSLVSVLPISIGGIGIRELVFITAASYAPISMDASVAFSLLFFLVTAISSLPGGILKAPDLTLPPKAD